MFATVETEFQNRSRTSQHIHLWNLSPNSVYFPAPRLDNYNNARLTKDEFPGTISTTSRMITHTNQGTLPQFHQHCGKLLDHFWAQMKEQRWILWAARAAFPCISPLCSFPSWRVLSFTSMHPIVIYTSTNYVQTKGKDREEIPSPWDGVLMLSVWLYIPHIKLIDHVFPVDRLQLSV